MALYRTHRPAVFADVVGQDAVVHALQATLRSERFPHAAILHGPPGNGKTTLARLIAKSLTCDRYPSDEPCNECESCRSIDQGANPDVFEMDAASNRGVDDAQELLRRVQTVPIRRHVFIIDEAHMLTAHAQNALLKALEEPPERVHFLFCTTEPEKLLDAIRSRCPRYPLRRAAHGDLVALMRRVCDKEGISAPDEAVELVVAAADGAYRDALTLLAQCAPGGELTVEAASMLGRPRASVAADLVDAVADGRAADALGLISAITGGASSADGVCEALADHLRLALHAAASGSVPEGLSSDPAARDRAAGTGGTLGQAGCVRLLGAIEAARERAAEGWDFTLALESALLRAIEGAADKVKPVAAMRGPQRPAVAANPPAPAAPAAAVQAVKPQPEPATHPATEPELVAPPSVAAESAGDDGAAVAGEPDLGGQIDVPDGPAEPGGGAAAQADPPAAPDSLEGEPSQGPGEGAAGPLADLRPNGMTLDAVNAALAMPALKLMLRTLDAPTYLALRTARCTPRKGGIVLQYVSEKPPTARQITALSRLLESFGFTGEIDVERFVAPRPKRRAAAPAGQSRKPALSDRDLDEVAADLGLTPVDV